MLAQVAPECAEDRATSGAGLRLQERQCAEDRQHGAGLRGCTQNEVNRKGALCAYLSSD